MPMKTRSSGYKVYSSVAEVPDPVDLAVIVVPAPAVAAQLTVCGQRGIKGAIIISGGFGETGPEGAAYEREMQRIAAAYGMRVLGPNCIGTIDTHTPLNSTFVSGMPRSGDIAFLCSRGRWLPRCSTGRRGRGLLAHRQPGQPDRREQRRDAR